MRLCGVDLAAVQAGVAPHGGNQRTAVTMLQVALTSLAGVALAGGMRLWWPGRGDDENKVSLGQSLMTGAALTVALVVLQIGVNDRAKDDQLVENRRQANAERRGKEQARRRDLRLAVEGQRALHGITLQGEDLRHWFLVGKSITNADLTRVDLRATNLSQSDLQHASLVAARLAGALFLQARLDNADLRRAHGSGVQLDQASLRHVHLERAQLPDMSAVNADFSGAYAERAKMSRDRLSDPRSSLAGAIFRGADLTRVDFRGADLVDADLRQAELYGADFRGADLTGARLDGAFRGDGVVQPRVKYDRHTRWPAGFRIRDLEEFMDNASTPRIRHSQPVNRGGIIRCGTQCFQGSATNRLPTPNDGGLVAPPIVRSSCRTRFWQGQWHLIAPADRRGPRGGSLFVCKRGPTP